MIPIKEVSHETRLYSQEPKSLSSVREMDILKHSSLKSFLRAMIALWILISPWVLVHLSMAPPSQVQISAGVLWNFLVVGTIMMVGSILQTGSTVWAGRFNAALGVWLIASPWILVFSSDLVLTWNAVLFGIFAVVTSGFQR